MSVSSDEKQESWRRRRNPSLFGPLILIAIGLYFLLSNMGLVSGLNWLAALQLWPLLLIFIGLNIIVRQAPRPLGTLFSLLLALLAIGVFSYALLLGEDNPLFSRLGIAAAREFQTEQIEFAADDVSAADIHIDFGPPGGELYALEDSNNLIEGSVTYLGDLVFTHSLSGGQAEVALETRNTGGWFFNPGNWIGLRSADPWQIGLNPGVETDLSLNVSAGSVGLDISELTLSSLAMDMSAGDGQLFLPGGDYDAQFGVSAGSMAVTLPPDGRHAVAIDVSAGSLVLYLPATMEARLEVNRSAGNVDLPQGRFDRVSGDGRDGVWQTAGYEDASNRLDLSIDISAGNVDIVQQ
jgi:hypothetical protein